MTITLTGLNGPMAGDRATFDRPGRYLIGRGEECNLHIPAGEEFAYVSRRHCMLEVSRRSVRVCDLNSCNGTYVNGVQLAGSETARRAEADEADPKVRWRELKNGDEIRIGRVYLRVTIDATADRVECRPLAGSC